MSTADLLTEGIFTALHLLPQTLRGDIATTHVGLNYTTALNVVALLVFGYLYWLYRNAERFGGGGGYAKDPVCGMQVRTVDAPAHERVDGHDHYFCSDRCHDAFRAEPGRHLGAQQR